MFGHVDSPLKPYNFMFNPKKLVIANGRSRVRIQLISKKILSLIQYEMFFWKKVEEWTLAELGIPKKRVQIRHMLPNNEATIHIRQML